MTHFSFPPIAYVHSPYKQKFAIPRQANLVEEAVGEIVFEPGFSDPNTVRELEQFSHLWVVFVFHETLKEGWSPLVHPPRLGGRQKVGVFASRSTHRPNPIGISVVKLLEVKVSGSGLILKICGLDLLDGTPVLDIKPYIPYADKVNNASAGYASEAPDSTMDVHFSDEARLELSGLQQLYPDIEKFIVAVLQQDPRPAYKRKSGDSKQYGMHLYDCNIKWTFINGAIIVNTIEKVDEPA